MTGRTLAHYQIVEKLGEGGMGVVWKARDTHLDRFVALKLLPAEKLADPERKRRFVQEAKSASALNHPNIIHIYDISDAEGVPFLAMEYVAGKTLDVLIGRKGLRLQDALKYAIQIVDALAKAHSAGIVHRDLKPSNIMVTDGGLVKVLDFGLAKLTEQGLINESAATRSLRQEAAHTQEGVILGTAAYMSPEQAEGKPLDARSDIFSFGDDNKYLYYTKSKDRKGGVWKMAIEGGPETRILESVVVFNFAVTARGVYFMTQPDPRASSRLIQFLSFADQTTRLIATIKQDVYHGFSVSPDERWLVYAPSGPGGSNVMLVENFE